MSRKAAPGLSRGPFSDVTPDERWLPSWIPKQRKANIEVRTLRPAPLPRGFADAISDLAPSSNRGQMVAVAGSSQRFDTPSSPPTSAKSILPESFGLNELRESAPPLAAQLLQQQALEQRQAFQQALQGLLDARVAMQQATLSQVTELATIIAQRVIAHELSLHPEIVRSLVQDGILALEQQDRLVIRIGRGFADQETELFEEFSGESELVQVVVDRTLNDYGCVVETEHGWVDESIETRLATLLQGLRADSDAP